MYTPSLTHRDSLFFFFNDTATTEIYTLSLHDALPISREVVKAGVQTDARLLYAWFRVSGQDRQIKAGNYELTTGLTPYVLLQKLARGEESLKALTLVEGWNWRQVRAALAREEFLRQESAGMDDATLMQALGRAGVAPEGQ